MVGHEPARSVLDEGLIIGVPRALAVHHDRQIDNLERSRAPHAAYP